MAVIAKGLEGIVANSTRLSDVMGAEGRLVYAGYDINELAGNASYEEVVHLLWHGHLPNKKELDELTADLRVNRALPKGLLDFLRTAPKSAEPMDVMRTAVSMLGLYDHGISDADKTDANQRRALSITSKIGVIAAYFHRSRQGKDFPPVRRDLGEAAHFLYLITGEEPSKDAAKTLDVAYVLHADHGMNASTFSARVTIATLSDMYSAITSAIGTLKGPLHGGANEGVIHMLVEIGSEEKDHGHRPPRLQNARPARAAPAGDGHQTQQRAWRAEMDQDVRAHCRHHEGKERAERQRRFLFRHRLSFARHPD
jgi:citrate synthase